MIPFETDLIRAPHLACYVLGFVSVSSVVQVCRTRGGGRVMIRDIKLCQSIMGVMKQEIGGQPTRVRDV